MKYGFIFVFLKSSLVTVDMVRRGTNGNREKKKKKKLDFCTSLGWKVLSCPICPAQHFVTFMSNFIFAINSLKGQIILMAFLQENLSCLSPIISSLYCCTFR